MRRAERDGRRAAVNQAVTAAHNQTVAFGRAPGKAETRGNVVKVVVDARRLNASGGKRRTRITIRPLVQQLHVVAHAKIERQVVPRAPVVLKKEPGFV